jgi:hypothetical protein
MMGSDDAEGDAARSYKFNNDHSRFRSKNNPPRTHSLGGKKLTYL